MISQIQNLLKQNNQFYHQNSGITVLPVESAANGFSLAKEILYTIINNRTALYLSGGRTPKQLYQALAQEERFMAGAVGLVDERYTEGGGRMHKNSNEKMLADSGLLRYLNMRDITFYSVLQGAESREQSAEVYDARVRSLLATYPKHIAIMGIGLDGHTAGIPAIGLIGSQGQALQALQAWVEDLDARSKSKMVIDYNDENGFYKERVTMTFLGLSMMDLLIVLVFGNDKKETLEKMFTDGSEEEIPARFFKRPEIAKKTLLITDQKV